MRTIQIKEAKPQETNPFDPDWKYRLRVIINGFCNHANYSTVEHRTVNAEGFDRFVDVHECDNCGAWKLPEDLTWSGEYLEDQEPITNNGVTIQL